MTEFKIGDMVRVVSCPMCEIFDMSSDLCPAPIGSVYEAVGVRRSSKALADLSGGGFVDVMIDDDPLLYSLYMSAIELVEE